MISHNPVGARAEVWRGCDFRLVLRRVFSSRGATTPRPLRVLFDLFRKPAEFIGNIGGTEGQIAQTIGGLAQED